MTISLDDEIQLDSLRHATDGEVEEMLRRLRRVLRHAKQYWTLVDPDVADEIYHRCAAAIALARDSA